MMLPKWAIWAVTTFWEMYDGSLETLRDGQARAANPYKSTDPILHREPPLLKNLCSATGVLKNLKSVGVP
jgi:hypothetical protein